MKLLAVFSLLTFSLFSQTLSWRGDYSTAHQEALGTHRSLLVLVVKCDDERTHRILREVFMDQPYIDKLKKRVVSVMVPYEGSTSYPIEMFYTTEFPALFLVDEKELFLHKPLYGDDISKENLEKIVIELP